MTTPLRRIFGNSNRPGHLRLSRVTAGAIAFLPAVAYPQFTALCQWVGLESHPTRAGFAVLCWVAATACAAHEVWATADQDEQEKRLPKSEVGWQRRTLWDRLENWYWWQFGKIDHRSRLSHGLIIGTVIRLAYGWWWLLPVLWLLSPWVLAAWCMGTFVADLAHLALDL
jgi:hypothetical protein